MAFSCSGDCSSPSEASDEQGEVRSGRRHGDGGLGVVSPELLVAVGRRGTAEGQRQRRQEPEDRPGGDPEEKWDPALAAIKQADAASPKTAYDQYKINELLWYVYLQQGRNADAARLLEQQMASGQMPAGEKVQRTKTLAQLYFRAGSYGKGIQYANQYLKSVPGDQEMQLMVAQGYYQQKDYKGAIAAAERIIKSGQRPSEDAAAAAAAQQLRDQRQGGHRAGPRAAPEVLPEPRHLAARARRLHRADQARRRTALAVSPCRGRGRAHEAAPVHGHGAGAGRRRIRDRRAERSSRKASPRACSRARKPRVHSARSTRPSAVPTSSEGAAEGARRSSRLRRPATRCMRSASSISALANTPRLRKRCEGAGQGRAVGRGRGRDAFSASRCRATARRRRPTRRSRPSRTRSSPKSPSSGRLHCADQVDAPARHGEAVRARAKVRALFLWHVRDCGMWWRRCGYSRVRIGRAGTSLDRTATTTRSPAA